MEYEKKDNSGALFKNADKTTETDPDYKGNAMIDGTDFWFNAWINTSKAGQKYMKASFSPKQQTHANGVQQVQQAIAPQIEPLSESEDDIPF
jgi:hypothetical protein